MDSTEVTNEQFAKFVDATKYVTVAETKPTIEEFPGAPEENLVAGMGCMATSIDPCLAQVLWLTKKVSGTFYVLAAEGPGWSLSTSIQVDLALPPCKSHQISVDFRLAWSDL